MANVSGQISDISPKCGGPAVSNPVATASFAVITGGGSDLRFTEDGDTRITEEGEPRFIDA